MMQDYPGAPGTARPGNAGTAEPAACGGAAVQPLPPAPDHTRSSAMPMPLAPDHNRSRAVPMPMPQAPGHQRSAAASMASPGHADCGPVTAGRSVPMATAPVPAQASWQFQVVLPCVPATPGTLIYTQAHRLNRHFRLAPRRSRASVHPRPPLLREDHRGATHRQPALRLPKLAPTTYPTLSPILCILPSKYPAARRLSPPARAAPTPATRAPRPHPPAENLLFAGHAPS